MDIYSLWDKVLVDFEMSLSKNHFDTWFKNTYPIRIDDGTYIISVPNEFVRDWVEQKYTKDILKITKETNPEIKKIQFIISKKEVEVVEVLPTKKPTNSQTELPLQTGINTNDNLNPKYSLDSLIVGPFNEVAYSAGQAIIKKPGAYNPFFIYGSTGTGKTHLVQAVGNSLKEKNPDINIFYVSADKFSNDFVTAIQNKKVDQLKERYRSYDVLIIDDIQFLSGRDKTQEELFHLFNNMTEHGKQIMFTSDKHPNHIIGLEERVKSRLSAGMIVDIGKPEFESRLAILQSKCLENDVIFSPDVLQFIAQQVDGSIRELEGIFNTLSVQQEVRLKPLSLSDVKEIIKNHIKPKRSISVEEITKTVADYFHIEEKLLYESVRRREIVLARQIAMYLMRNDYNISYPLIGRKLGGKDHTTVMHSCERIEKELVDNPLLTQDVDHIRSMLTTL